jgi:DNA polymerase-3 subunit epsilon
MLLEPRAVYLDTETTGIDATSEIVDIAIIDAGGGILFESLVRPRAPIPAEVYAIHGISDEMVATAPAWPEIGPLVSRILLNSTVVVYNADFDLRMVNQENTRYGAPLLPDTWHCAMLRYAAFAGEWNSHRGSYRWHKLGAAMTAFGFTPTSHRAAADAGACRMVVRGMAGSRDA